MSDPGSPTELSPALAELVAAARREGQATVGRFTRAELAPVGWDAQLDDDLTSEERLRRAVITAQVRETLPRGPLADLLALAIEHRRTSASWQVRTRGAPDQAGAIWGLVVLDLPEPDVVLVQYAVDDVLHAELQQVSFLADELTRQAFRAPASKAERTAGPGTVAIFLGPDRRAQAIATRIQHDWDKPRATLLRWSYTLFGRRHDGDWVARQPMKVRGIKPERVAGHLVWRLGKPDPRQQSR